MASRHIVLCDAVVSHLNAPAQQGGFVAKFTAARVNIPRYDLEAVTGLQVIVFPGPRAPEKLARNEWLKTYTVFVLLAAKVRGDTDQSQQEIEDCLIELAEQIENALWDRTFVGMASTPVEGVEFPPYLEDLLRQDDVFAQIIEVTYSEGIISGR